MDAKKSYRQLLKEKGISAAIQSAMFVLLSYCLNRYVLQEETSVFQMIFFYFVMCSYYTWKPKLIRFLRGKLRGDEFRNKSD